MAGLSDLFGRNGLLEQLMLWGMLNQVLSTTTGPALESLGQDVNSAHPVVVLPPATLADAAVRGMTTVKDAQADAARSGIDAARFATLIDLATVRLAPADLATAVLRSYMTTSAAETQAALQGIDAAQFATMVDLQGDGIAPEEAVRALLRGLIVKEGTGADSTSYTQAIAESRLHDKWAGVLAELGAQLLSPADAASAVVRNFLSASAAEAVAAKSGVDTATMATMIQLSADAPGPEQLAEALRRKIIGESGTGAESTSFEQGIAEGRLADKWAPVIKGLAQLWPTPADALDAQVKGQLTDAEASALYEQLGGDPQFETWLYNSIGEGPSPLEAATLAARGIIPWTGTGPASTSYEQAVRESHYRDKWTTPYQRLAEHVYAPSTVATLLSHQVITKDVATAALLQNNMSQEQAAAYIAEAEFEAVSDYRGLAQSSVVDMYFAHLLSHDQAIAILEGLHVSPESATLLLGYADIRYETSAVIRAVGRLETLFASRKIGVDTTRAALLKVGISADVANTLIDEWSLQASFNVKTLTVAQVTDAYEYAVISEAEAMTLLGTLGYTKFDAWVLLSVKAKAALPDKPANDAAPAQPAVSPGTT